MFTSMTPRVKLGRGLVVLTAVVFMVGACAPPPAAPPPQVATETPSPAAQPPTEAPTDTAIPTAELAPEEPAVSTEQVAGKWAMRILGGGGGDAAVFTLADDGTFSFDGVGGEHDGMNVGTGTFRFEGDVLLLESRHCLVPGPTDVFFACTGQYHVFVAMGDGAPGRLRFAVIDDAFLDRKKSLDNKTLSPYLEP